MKRPLGLTLFGILFILWGFRGMNGITDIPAENLGWKFFRFGFVFLTFAVGLGLLQLKPWTMRAYSVWVAVVLLCGGMSEYFVAGEDLLPVVVFLTFVGAIYVAIGLYLRGKMKAVEPKA